MRVVVVTGSRRWRLSDPIRNALLGAELVIHGGALGADMVAHNAAMELELDVLVLCARWRRLGKAAGPERNERMAVRAQELASAGHDVHCYAFPLSGSRGTWDCVRRMREQGIATTVYGSNEE